ncbi:unnamed protein product [Haemonchus placei]|uniref:Secreted protein n=1 Tax=Haemonchus placei TaxID=6290 RepID=A0A0N4WT58_HAEPC|nr:unnamed protein product [Haemonchus placei]
MQGFFIVGYENTSFIFVQAGDVNRVIIIYKYGKGYEEIVIFEMSLTLAFLACITANVAAEAELSHFLLLISGDPLELIWFDLSSIALSHKNYLS